jgi:DNA repair protein RadA/Sms
LKKEKRRFVCQACGAEFPRWIGKCEVCGSWNTVLEEIGKERFHSKPSRVSSKYFPPTPITEFQAQTTTRLSVGFPEIDVVLGGGIVCGSLILLAGEPGVGKSTLLLEIVKQMDSSKKIFYISGEESPLQIRLRAERMRALKPNLYLSSEVVVENIVDMIKNELPSLIFIDSIQTITRESLPSQAGTVTQLRESTQVFLEIAKSTGCPIILVGHITKDGSIAGPKVLEHLVDLVLYFESDKLNYYRILRGIKNRYGPVGDVAILEMHSEGIREVSEKHKLFISSGQEERIGSALCAIVEGSRALCVEIQALVIRSAYGQARRMSEGIDNRRLILISAVLEKYLGFKLSECDIFSNLAGGLNVDEPALDLAIASTIVSSYLDKKLEPSLAVIGEVGLSGEIRPVSSILPRIKELKALGIKKIFLPAGNLKEISELEKENLSVISHVREIFEKCILHD